MRRVAIFVICLILILCCGDQRNSVDRDTIAIETSRDEAVYPMLIDDGKKIVYQFGRMTADKGLKLYLDTVPNTNASDEEVRLLFD